MGQLDGKVALITGGAGSIGSATARVFAARALRCWCVMWMSASRGWRGRSAASRWSRTRSGSWRRSRSTPEDVFDHVMRVNVRGPFLLAKHALAVMRDGGSLIINSSVVGLTSDAGIAAYATSKHAVVGLMRTAAKEAASRGIRVNTIHPGPVDNAFQHAIEVTATGLGEAEVSAIFEEMISLRRHASADEVARAVLFLATGGFVTGATLAIDGGMSI